MKGAMSKFYEENPRMISSPFGGIDGLNRELLLKPGMTADVKIEVLRRTGTLRIDNLALRFRPPLNPDVVSEFLDGLTWPERPSRSAEQARRLPESPARAPVTTGPSSVDLAPPEKTVLWRWVDEVWQPVPVWTGIAAERLTEVLCGTDAGDRIVTEAVRPKGQAGLADAFRLASPGNRRL